MTKPKIKGEWKDDLTDAELEQLKKSDLKMASHKPRISLCMIVGNVSEYIHSCLLSFAPYVDEIAIVRAIGRQEPDDTVDRARAIAAAHGVPFLFDEYRNAPGRADWPHVDDFAKARQLSFDIATGDYAMWADSDDVLAAGGEEIRRHAAAGSYPVIICNYEIFGRGISVPRERIILRSAPGKWTYPVHECYHFDINVNGVVDDRIVIQHLPKVSKSGSNERNLRILSSLKEDEMTAGMLYHLHCEYLGAGRKVDAIEIAKRAIAAPDIGKPEKYELFCNLARMSSDPDMQAAFLLQAYATDPGRREAIGMMACNAIDRGVPADALSYARHMKATPRPDASWNDRGGAYGWIGEDVMQQALRANGQILDAEVIRVKMLANANRPIISLIHATRGRARQASAARKIWLDLAEFPEAVEHIFCIDDDDRESDALRRFHYVSVKEGGGCVRAWNAGASRACGSVLVQVSDDWMPPGKWDSLILERLGNVIDSKVLAVSDGKRSDQLLCLAIMTRARYHQQAITTPSYAGPVMFHPDFLGVYSDNWFTHCAYRDDVVVEARDLVFEHFHPILGHDVPVDRTYAEQNAPERYAQGKETFDRLMSEQSPHVPWWRIPGWCDYTDLYGAIAQQVPENGTVVEVGVWLGQSLAFMGQALNARKWLGRLVAIDTFRGEEGQVAHADTVAANGGSNRLAFEQYIAAAGVTCDIIEGDSAQSASQFADESVDFCFIDAAHDYESAKRDIAAWRPKIKPGGILAGHDYPHEDVRRAATEAFGDAVGVKGRCWIIRCSEAATVR